MILVPRALPRLAVMLILLGLWWLYLVFALGTVGTVQWWRRHSFTVVRVYDYTIYSVVYATIPKKPWFIV